MLLLISAILLQRLLRLDDGEVKMIYQDERKICRAKNGFKETENPNASQGKKYTNKVWTDRMLYLRVLNNLTQAEVARVLNISQVAYRMYEMGKRRIPVDKLVALARFYHVSVDYLVGIKNEQ